MLLTHGQCPVLEGGCFQLNGGAASAAEQVVVMVLYLAVAVQGLTLNALDRVELAGVSQRLQHTVGGCERDLFLAVREGQVQILC